MQCDVDCTLQYGVNCTVSCIHLTVEFTILYFTLYALHVRLLVANCADERGQTDRQKDIQTDRQTDRQRDIQTDRQTD